MTKALPGHRGDVGTGPKCCCDLRQVMSSPMVTVKKEKNQLTHNDKDRGWTIESLKLLNCSSAVTMNT